MQINAYKAVSDRLTVLAPALAPEQIQAIARQVVLDDFKVQLPELPAEHPAMKMQDPTEPPPQAPEPAQTEGAQEEPRGFADGGPVYAAYPSVKFAGQIAQGNIDLAHRPIVRNPDGSISTVRSMGVNIDGREVLIPTVSDDGRIMSPDESIQTYRQTGRHLGMFATPEASTAYAKALHEQQAKTYLPASSAPY
jgi:hypothetical protein